jgi:O-antigen ligase
MFINKKISLFADQVTGSIRHNFIFSVVKKLLTKELKTFTITLLYFGSLYFSTSNRSLILFSLIFLGCLYLHLRNFTQSLFLAFVATVTFAKGKSVEILLLPKELIPQSKIFNVSYFFTLYISDIFLVMLFFLYTRTKFMSKQVIKRMSIPSEYKLPIITLVIYILCSLVPAIGSNFPEVILLSGVQFIRMLLIFCLPLYFPLLKKKQHRQQLYFVILASVIFQSFWTAMQHFTGGNLGKDIESMLPGFEVGIGSSENFEVLRATGTFFEASILGTFLFMNMCLILFLLFQKKELIKKKLYYFGLIAGFVAIIYTASRGIYLLAVLLALSALFVKRQQVWKYVQKVPNKKKIAVFILLFMLPFVSFFVTRISSLPNLFDATGSGTYRVQIALYALRLSSINPLGVGLNLSPYYFATAFPLEKFIFDPSHPHNIIFQLLAENGIIGTVVFCIFLFFLARPFLSKKKKINGFFIASSIFILCAQFYPIFISQPEILSLFFLYAGFSLSVE